MLKLAQSQLKADMRGLSGIPEGGEEKLGVAENH